MFNRLNKREERRRKKKLKIYFIQKRKSEKLDEEMKRFLEQDYT